MNYASIVKDSVATPELFRSYGLAPDRAGFVVCPFHAEKTGSMKVYDGSGGYHCFGCGAHGDVIGFVRRYFNLSFPEALAKINDDFRLGLPLGRETDYKARRQAWLEADRRRRQAEAGKKERDALYAAYDEALTEWVRLDRLRIERAPGTPSEPFDDVFADALKKMDRAAYMLDAAESAIYEYEHRTPLREVI